MPRVGHVLHPAGGVVTIRRHQRRVGRRRRRRRPGPGRAAVGADIDCGRQTIRSVVIGGGVVDPRPDAARRRPQRPRPRRVVEALAVDGFDRVAVAVVDGLRLLQHRVAGHAARRRPGRSAGAVGRVVHHVAGRRRRNWLFVHRPPGADVGDQVAAVVVVVVGRQRRGRDGPGRRVHVEDLRLVDAALVVVTRHGLGAQQVGRRRLRHAVGGRERHAVARVLLHLDWLRRGCRRWCTGSAGSRRRSRSPARPTCSPPGGRASRSSICVTRLAAPPPGYSVSCVRLPSPTPPLS